MKYFVLALFVAVAAGAPTPDASGEPVELIVSGVPEGQPLEVGDIVDIKLKEIQNGVVASEADLLHPLTAVGIAEAAAAAEVAPSPVQIVDNQEEQSVPEIIGVIPIPENTEQIPDIIGIMPIPAEVDPVPEPEHIGIMPIPAEVDEVPEHIAVIPIPETDVPVAPIGVLPPRPEPEADPSPIVLPEPIPEAAPQLPSGEVFNNGLVLVEVNGEDAGVLSTIQSWFNVFVNYISNGIQTTQQVV